MGTQLARRGLDGLLDGDRFSMQVVMISYYGGRMDRYRMYVASLFDHGTGEGEKAINSGMIVQTNGREMSSTIHVAQGLEKIDAAGRAGRKGVSRRGWQS